MHIIGTAGHVDHGKSALVHALSGEETDRLPEEKRRALTIELGFASYLDSKNERIGIIDVPGHERFIRNMVSGTWALELALLCVASDDGWMAQTTDHAHILKGMLVPSIIVVITKVDIVNESRLQEVIHEIDKNIYQIFNTSFPIHAVSAHTGVGIENLKKLISKNLPANTIKKFPPMLYIDRSFILKGIGTVVTGSLVGEQIEVGQNITILPSQKVGKIRSLQMFNQKVNTAKPISRCAISLQGISKEDANKGFIATIAPEQFTLCDELFVTLAPIKNNQPIEIKNHQHVALAFGSDHTEASIHFLNEKKDDNSSTLLCRLQLANGIFFYQGQPIVIMSVGASKVLSYAKVVYTSPLNRKMQRALGQLFLPYSSPPSLFDSMEVLSLYLFSFVKSKNTLPSVLTIEGENYIALDSYHIKEKTYKEIEKIILERASQSQGVPLQSAKFIQPYPSELIELIINNLIKQHSIVLCDGSLLIASKDDVELTKRASELYQEIQDFGFQGFPVKSIEKSDKEHIGCLLRNKRIIIIDSMVIYLVTTYDQILSELTQHLSLGDTFSIADAKEKIGISRKFMIPLLNQIEKDGYIMRIGDRRKVIKKKKFHKTLIN